MEGIFTSYFKKKAVHFAIGVYSMLLSHVYLNWRVSVHVNKALKPSNVALQ